MKTSNPKPNRFHLLVQSFSSTSFGSWLFSRTLHYLDWPFIKLSKGRSSLTRFLAGMKTVTLHATGAKSGKPRSIPLVAYFDEDKVILIASNFGQPHYPAWYYNLSAHPDVQLFFDGETRAYTAQEIDGSQKENYWNKVATLYPVYKAYQRRVVGRHIPVFVLEPHKK